MKRMKNLCLLATLLKKENSDEFDNEGLEPLKNGVYLLSVKQSSVSFSSILIVENSALATSSSVYNTEQDDTYAIQYNKNANSFNIYSLNGGIEEQYFELKVYKIV